MIARVWEGVVPLEKAAAYGAYLGGEFGVEDYRKIPGNQGAILVSAALRLDCSRLNGVLGHANFTVYQSVIAHSTAAKMQGARYERDGMHEPA